jgi:hypothetical protein
MQSLPHRHTLALGLGALLCLTVAMPASASEDVYRCRVLGDRGACERLPASADADVVTRLVPGSYARYLMYLGRPVEQAIAEARTIGEEPTLQDVRRQTQPRLSGFEAHERYVRGGPALDDRPGRGISASKRLPD